MLTPYCPQVVPNAMYSLKDTAKLLGVHPNTIRNYTLKGAIRAKRSKWSSWPRYSGAEILKFWKETI